MGEEWAHHSNNNKKKHQNEPEQRINKHTRSVSLAFMVKTVVTRFCVYDLE